MKKLLWVAPLALALYACSDVETAEKKEETPATEQEEKVETGTTSLTEKYVASTTTWEVDERLQEPTEDTVCAMCNMKVYTKDHEMGVFSAQAIKADGSIAFYDDIGCLLNAEFANEEVNDKYVRDYISLNWMNVEQAYIVKTQLKSPMNWGYIFFKFEEDANTYIAENEGATLTSYTEVRQQALERRKAKIKAGTNVDAHHLEDGHTHSQDEAAAHEE
ncbi:MAG: nitrous oxide reductase accessory protein NosL [Caryophanon sp.]|nr:nitrous oxide reductase accessory protein NosL [Caryophanon sp.]